MLTTTETVFAALSYEMDISSGLQTRATKRGFVKHDMVVTEVIGELCEDYFPGANLIVNVDEAEVIS